MKEWTYDWEHKIKITTPQGKQKTETNKCFEYFNCFKRIKSIVKTAEHFGKNPGYMQQVATKYEWQRRVSEMMEYETHIKDKELREQQTDLVATIKNETDEDNKALRKAEQDILVQLGYIKDPVTKEFKPNHDVSKIRLIETLTSIQKALSNNRRDMYRAVGLPDKLNDKQVHEAEVVNTGVFELNHDFENEEEKLERYADYFKRLNPGTNNDPGD